MADFRVIGNDVCGERRARIADHIIMYIRYYFRIVVRGQFYNNNILYYAGVVLYITLLCGGILYII